MLFVQVLLPEVEVLCGELVLQRLVRVDNLGLRRLPFPVVSTKYCSICNVLIHALRRIIWLSDIVRESLWR